MSCGGTSFGSGCGNELEQEGEMVSEEVDEHELGIEREAVESDESLSWRSKVKVSVSEIAKT